MSDGEEQEVGSDSQNNQEIVIFSTVCPVSKSCPSVYTMVQLFPLQSFYSLLSLWSLSCS